MEKELHQYNQADNSYWEGAQFKPLKDYKINLTLSTREVMEVVGFDIQRPNGMIEHHACVNTQVGCKFGCKFCVSGERGFGRHLGGDEILSQIPTITEAMNVAQLDHLVFMGSGDPLDNPNFIPALKKLTSENEWYKKRVSFATVGDVPEILKAADENLDIRMLWISLHAPTDEKRREIMPIAKKYGVHEVIDASKVFAEKNPLVEVRMNYLVYKGFNDGEKDAKDLANLLKDTQQHGITIQLTEPNRVTFFDKSPGVKEDIERFGGYLEKFGAKNKITRFVAAGRMVDGGCGNLYGGKK